MLTTILYSWMSKIGSKLMNLVMEQGVPELTAWNQCSNDLINIARVSEGLFDLEFGNQELI